MSMDELWMDRMNAELDANCQYLHKGGLYNFKMFDILILPLIR